MLTMSSQLTIAGQPSQEAGATDEDLRPIVAEAIAESYFTDWGRRCPSLVADFTHVQSIDSELWHGRIQGLL
jgi:hypothetical protein